MGRMARESASTSLDRLEHRNSTGTRQARQARPQQRLDSASTATRRSLDGASTARQLDSQGSSWIPGWIVAIQVNHATKSTYPYSSYRAG